MRPSPRSAGSDYLKSIVFGGLDGIITTFAVIATVAGADLDVKIVILMGFANLVADGISMGFGDCLSSKAEQEFVENEYGREKWCVAAPAGMAARGWAAAGAAVRDGAGRGPPHRWDQLDTGAAGLTPSPVPSRCAGSLRTTPRASAARWLSCSCRRAWTRLTRRRSSTCTASTLSCTSTS